MSLLILLAARCVLMVLALFFGMEVKGARRWISFAGISIQPSEFMKPAFVIVCAWLFAEHRAPAGYSRQSLRDDLARHRRGAAGRAAGSRPDACSIAGAWGAMFFMAGMPWIWIVGARRCRRRSASSPPIRCSRTSRGRIDRFLTGEGDTFQVDTAPRGDHPRRLVRRRARARAPSSASSRTAIPTSSSAVAAEEFGIVLCIADRARSSPSSCCAA